MLDVYELDGEIVVYHTFDFLGNSPLASILGDMKSFLDENPGEILSIIFESNVSAAAIGAELVAAGLMPQVHVQDLSAPWPTLQTMIDDDKRLVVFSESDNATAAEPWQHYAWDYVFDTPYSFNAPEDFSCDVNRGSVSNGLYLVNHWITTGLGVGDSVQAAIVNAYPFLLGRLEQCQSETGRFPNFIGIDFYHIGDAVAVAETMNGISTSTSNIFGNQKKPTLFPNPVINQFTLTSEFSFQGIILDVFGRQVMTFQMEAGDKVIYLQELPSGTYFLTGNRTANNAFFLRFSVK